MWLWLSYPVYARLLLQAAQRTPLPEASFGTGLELFYWSLCGLQQHALCVFAVASLCTCMSFSWRLMNLTVLIDIIGTLLGGGDVSKQQLEVVSCLQSECVLPFVSLRLPEIVVVTANACIITKH